jgi:hypothetical protein
MKEAIQLLEERVKYLDELIRLTPIERSFSSQHRLVEAQFILHQLLNIEKKQSNESNKSV